MGSCTAASFPQVVRSDEYLSIPGQHCTNWSFSQCRSFFCLFQCQLHHLFIPCQLYQLLIFFRNNHQLLHVIEQPQGGNRC